MTASVRARLRRLWLDLHLWIGVGLFLVLVPLGLSGSALVWGQAIDRLAYPARYAISAGPASLAPSAYLAAGQRVFGERAKATQVRMPETPGQPVTVSGRQRARPAAGGRAPMLTAWIDPPTGRVLDVADPQKTVHGWVHRLHGQLLIPQVGRKVVGWLGWAMFANCATGIWLWWPRGAFVRGLRWRRSPSTLNNLHHLVGFWIALPLAALSLTGVYIAFPKTSHALFGAPPSLRPQPSREGSGHEPPGPKLDIDAVAVLALKAAPGARLASIGTPEQGGWRWRVEVRSPDAAFIVNGVTGAVRAARERTSDPVSAWMRRVHDGGGAGPIWQGIIFVAGLAPTVLGISGVAMWLRRRRLRRMLRAGAVSAAR